MTELQQCNQRYIPEPIRTTLRKEAYFGCAKCGDPILEYHHIIPWAESKHNDPKHMIALCPTHHRVYGKLARQKSYDLKENPKNKLEGKLYGELGTDKKITKFLVGSTTYENTPTIFSYYEAPIIRYVIEDHQALIDVYIPTEDMWPDVLIKRNDMIVNIGGMWDIECRTNYLKIRKKLGENFLEIDMRKEVASINGRFKILEEEFRFSPSETNIGGAAIRNGYFANCGTGIGIGDNKRRLLWPNYAMNIPRAKFVMQ